MVETFILQDREPEHSICFMTVQLFSVPSVAAELVVRDSFLEKLLQILQAIFTGQLFNGRLKLPPTPPANGQASPQSIGVRQQRCYHIFYDMRYLLSAAGVQQQVMHNPRHLMYFLDFLALFNAITPDRRAVSTHVEWESETWITVFHVSSHLGRAAKLLGGAFAGADTRRLQVGLGTTTKRILLSCLTLHQNNPEVHPPISFHTVRFGLSTYQVIDFAVDRQAVSFHHPMHWVLAEMLKNVKILKEEDLRSIGKSSLGELMGDGVDANGMLVILEFPLRVCVKLAQIRSGMWVRNGLALRSQAHHYRDNSMRDTMYDQDLYLLQCGLVIVDPNRMLVSMMDRFALLDWFSGTTIHDVYDADQATFMVEEFLFLLVTCLSEISIAAAWTMEEQIRREIIHFLALNQGTFTEVTKHISERMTDHSSFDRVLTQVSNYRPPDGTTDLGIFELKDECYDEVQPFFFHYTRNQRERVEEVLRERKKKKTGRDDAIAIPKKLDITEGPFTALRQVYMSEVFLQILYHALFNVARAYSDAPDTLIDAALHLIMLALVEHEDSFAWLTAATYFDSGAPSRDISSSPEAVPSGQTLVHLLCEIEDDAKLKGFKAKVGWILDRLSSMDGTSQMVAQSRRLAPGVQAGGKGSAEDAKRVAARARQAAIMQQFSARQKSLLESLAEDGSDDDDDELMYAEEEQAEPQKSLGSCILCQEDLDSQQAFGSLALIQPSRVMRTTPKQNAGCLQQSLDTPLTLDRNGPSGRRILGNAESEQPGSSARRREGFSPPNHRLGFYASTCGHLMHVACFKTYCRSVEQRHAQQIARNHPEDLSRSEYVCPLCKSLGNVILPVPDANPSAPSAPVTDETPLADWIRKINIDILKCSTTQSTDVQETDHGTGSFLPWFAEEALGAVLGRPDLANNVEPATYQMLDRLMQVLRPLSSETRSLRQAYQGRTIIAPPSRKMYMPEELVGYTIGVLEISLRGMAPSNGAGPIEGGSGSVADGLTEQTQQLLRSLLDCLRNLAMLDHSSKRGLSVIKQGLLKRLLPHWAGDDTVRSPLLLRDPFTILVEAAVVTPESLQQITALMYYATLVQTVFGLAQPSMWPQSHGGAASRGFAGLRSLHLGSQDLETARKIFPDVRWTVGNIIGFVGYARGNITLGFDQLDDASLAKMLCTYTLPFLRRAAILQRIVGAHVKSGSSDAAGPSGSSYWGSFETDSGVEDSEYVRLLKMLRIPPPAEALPIRAERQTAIAGLVEGWIKHAYAPLASLFRPLPIHPSPLSPAYAGQPAHLHPPHAHPTLLLEHPHIYELVPLPQDLATLLQESQRRKCKRCNEVPPEPAICLVCGDVVCYQCFCCQDEDDERGECNRHMDE